MMIVLLALSLLAQDPPTVTIPRATKNNYSKKVPESFEKSKEIDADPASVVTMMDDVIGDSKIANKECRLRWEVASGTYSPTYDFFPYQWRGRARMKLAEKRTGAEKVRLLEQAVEDLRASVDKDIAASKAFFSEAETALGKARAEGSGTPPPPPPVDKEPEFRSSLNSLLRSQDFTGAKALLDGGKDAFLTADKRATYQAQIEQASREFQNEKLSEFLEAARGLSPRDFASRRRSSFERDFKPEKEPKDVVAPTAAYDWYPKLYAAFLLLHEDKDALNALCDCAVGAVPLVDKGPNPWFTVVESLAWSVAEDALNKRVTESRSAASERRQALRTEAEGLARRWNDFHERVKKAAEKKPEFLARVEKRDTAAIVAGFPVDAEGVDSLIAQLDSSAEADDPARVLADVDRALREAAAKANLTVESRRRILSYRVVAISLRQMIQGRGVGDAEEACRDFRDALRSAGGAAQEVARYGPKVAAVFARLARD